jgi:bacillolysin
MTKSTIVSRQWSRLTLVATLAALAIPQTHAQSARSELVIAAARPDTLRAADAQVQSMLQRGELDLASVDADPLLEGRTHERLVQRHQGLPVFGGVVMRQMERDAVLTIFGRIYQGIAVPVQPALDEATAAEKAVAAVGRPEASAEEATLGILPAARGGYVLVWRMTVRSNIDVRDVSINASTGAVELNRSRLRRQLPNIGTGKGSGGDDKKVSASATSQGFVATDRTRPAVLAAFDFRGSLSRLNAYLLNGVLVDSDRAADSDNVWTDGAVVDAHVYQGWTYDYYYKRFGRRGMDDRNSEISTIVHPVSRADSGIVDDDTRDFFVNNAMYLGGRQLMFGDGDGVNLDYFSSGLDVVAHEYSHGVTEYSSNLDYVDESGALNEAFSDIMGVSTEFFFEPIGTGARQADWLIGEDVVLFAPKFIRSLSDPRSGGQPDHYSLRGFIGTDTDNGGVHYNATIPGHAFYLATAGGTNRVSGINVAGIGQANIERMEKIFYRAFVFFLGPGAQFRDARAATLQAAAELYGATSVDYAQLQRAWTAVGVN